MPTNSNSVSIVAKHDIDIILKSLKDITDLVVFNEMMGAASKTLIKNVELKHDKSIVEPSIEFLQIAQKLVIRGEGADYKIGPDPKMEPATEEDEKIGLGVEGDMIPNTEGNGLQYGSLNYDIWERDTYRKKLYHRIYGSLAPALPNVQVKDPFLVQSVKLNKKLYTEVEKVDFEKWFVGKLSNSKETLESTIFETVADTIEIDSWLAGYEDISSQALNYEKALTFFKPVIMKLERLEAELKVINDQIKELESI